MEERGVGEWNVGKGKKSSNAALSSVRSCCTDYWPGLGTFATPPVTIELLAVPRGLDHGMCVCVRVHACTSLCVRLKGAHAYSPTSEGESIIN